MPPASLSSAPPIAETQKVESDLNNPDLDTMRLAKDISPTLATLKSANVQT